MEKLNEKYAVVFPDDDCTKDWSLWKQGFEALLVRLYDGQPDYTVFAIPRWDSEAMYLVGFFINH